MVHYLGDAIYNVHAKESQVNDASPVLDGILETTLLVARSGAPRLELPDRRLREVC